MTIILVGLVCALAAALRLTQIGLAEHNVDQAYPIGQALRTLERGEWPLLGQATSVLFANPPLAGYLYLPLLAISRSALGVAIVVAAINSLGVGLAADALRRAFGLRTAVIGGVLLAVNPWLIEYSRSTWVQGVLPFYACALAWLLWPLLTGETRHAGRRWIAACVVFALAAGSYLLAYALALPVLVLMIAYRRRMTRVPRRTLWIGLAVVVIPALIYVGAVLVAPDAAARARSFGGGEVRVTWEAWDHAARLVTGRDYPLARGQEAPAGDAALRQTLTDAAHLIGLLAIIAGAGYSPRQPLLLIGWLVPIAVMTVTPQVVHPFYQLIGIPYGAGLAAYGIHRIIGWTERRHIAVIGYAVLGIGGLAFGGLMAINSIRFAQATAITPGIHGLGALPLEDGLRVGDAVRSAGHSSGLAVYADADEWTISSLAGRSFGAFWRQIDPARTVILPADGGVYVRMDDAPPPFFGLPPPARIALADGRVVLVQAAPPGHPLPNTVIPMASTGAVNDRPSLDLIGYAILDEAGATVTLVTAWQVIGVDGGWGFAPFAHIFDAAGSRVAIVDGAVVPGYVWRVGDRHLHRMTFTQPVDGYAQIGIGQYDANAAVNVLFDGSAVVLLPPR